MKYFIRLSYNGSPFSGWQIQKNAASIQGEVQKALSVLLKEEIEITGAGRTDAGVNAVNYIAHVEIPSKYALAGSFKREFIYKMNAILPREIQIHDIRKMHPEAHARFDAVSRTYKYFITLSADPFNKQFTYFYKKGKLDFDAMNEAAKHFLGTHDFSSLEKVGGQNKTSICTVSEAHWNKLSRTSPFDKINRGGTYVFTVTADRFLRNMVRAMVGSLIEVGEGRHTPEWIDEMLNEKRRGAAGSSVPGNALFLYEIKYPYKV